MLSITQISIEAGITGFESPAAEYLELGLSLDSLIIANPHATFLGVANGDSMNDVGIFSGDVIIVDRSLTVRHGDIIVANYNGQFVCKILDIKFRLLKSASPSFKPIPIKDDDIFQIEGVVISTFRLFKNNRRILAALA